MWYIWNYPVYHVRDKPATFQCFQLTQLRRTPVFPTPSQKFIAIQSNSSYRAVPVKSGRYGPKPMLATVVPLAPNAIPFPYPIVTVSTTSTLVARRTGILTTSVTISITTGCIM